MRPREKLHNLCSFLNEFLILLTFGFVYHCDPSLKISSFICWIKIRFNEPNVSFYNRAFVSDPKSLRILMCIYIACMEMLNILKDHIFLVLICYMRKCFAQTLIHLIQKETKFSPLYNELSSFKFMSLCLFIN